MSDLISRQAAIDALRTCYDTETVTMDNGDEYINYDDAVGEIEQLPSAQPEPQWIPITEKLPDFDKCVLATTSWGTITIAERWKDTKGEENWFVSEGECNAERDDIVAWKPLPEPYKEDDIDEFD